VPKNSVFLAGAAAKKPTKEIPSPCSRVSFTKENAPVPVKVTFAGSGISIYTKFCEKAAGASNNWETTAISARNNAFMMNYRLQELVFGLGA
jgi:hypothetical protein